MKRFTLSAAMVTLTVLGFGVDAQAGGLLHGLFGSSGSSGSLGSSGGSYGSSGGSYGSYGSSGGSYGSSGGSSGGITKRQERLIYRTARRSASSGSSGSTGSSGGSYGSTGSSGGSYGSHGSSGGSSGGLTRREERKIYRSASHGSSGSHGSKGSHGSSGSYGAASHGSTGSSSYGGGSYGATTSTYSSAAARYAAATAYAYRRPVTTVPRVAVQRPAPRPVVASVPRQTVVRTASRQPQRVFTAQKTVAPVKMGYAYVIVQLPEDATLYLGGNATHVAGGVRKFKIPVSDASKSYPYAIRAELTRNGQVYVARSTETLVAGKTVSVKVNDVAAANVNVATR